MVKALAIRLEQMGIIASKIQLTGVHGYWRQTKQDVMQFTGTAIIDGVQRSIGCWESMTDCLRYGFTVTDERGKDRSYAHFMVEAKGQRFVR